MPGKVKVKVLAGRNLPVMDKGSDTTDAYVEIKLGNITHKTDICRKSLNPQWNSSEWYRFEVDDAELQDEPLQLRLMDYDTYSANDAIGKVYISLNPLLLPEAQQHPPNAVPPISHSGKGAVMSGWIPVFDTMHGIRGEVNVIVKVELFNDFNKFRQSSCGVQFFHSPIIPHGYLAQTIHGFVEELVINDDPEYQWIDKIRTPRASNEARQVAFLKLSGQVQRKIGLKALELGANAVIGFRRCLDLEGDVGVVARGIGTAITLVRQQEQLLPHPANAATQTASPDALAQCGMAAPTGTDCNSPKHTRAESHGSRPPTTANLNINVAHRRSSDSDLSITPKGNSLTAGVCGGAVLRPSMNQESIDMLEYPFLSITKFPPGFILHIGGAVAARSVKLLERVPNPEEPAPRDAWWSELRTEVRSHMRALRCNAVLAYQETTAICDDVCVLSATGTAAVIDLHPSSLLPNPGHTGPPSTTKTAAPNNGKAEEIPPHGELTQTSSLDRTDFEKTDPMNAKQNVDNNARRKGGSERCGPCHIPYGSNSMPYRVSVTKCALCKKGRVPSVVLCSLEPPDGLAIVGRGCLLQAAITRARTPARGEPAARDISDQLPFLEYELHRLLLAKLRVRGMNAIFGLRTSIAVGANLVAAVGVGTGVLLAALGSGGGGPKVRAGPGDPQVLQALQQGLDDALQANRNVYQLHMEQETNGKPAVPSDTDESDEDFPDMELSAGNKDTCVLEVDDAEDLEVLRVLTEARPPAGLHVVNTQSVPGLLGCEGLVSVRNLQMFTQLWRARLASPPGPLHHHFHRLLQNVYFKLRRMVPCAICDLRFRLDLPEADEIQLVVTGMAVGLGQPPLESKKVTDTPPQSAADIASKKLEAKEAIGSGELKKSDSNEMIFTLEEEHITDLNGSNKPNQTNQPSSINTATHSVNGSNSLMSGASAWQSGVDMTPLAGVPGARVLRYLGNLDYIFVRESTSVREHGGLSGFLHGFITEVMAVIRAHVTALGGNAIVAFYMTELILSDNPHKNQAQCLDPSGLDPPMESDTSTRKVTWQNSTKTVQ